MGSGGTEAERSEETAKAVEANALATCEVHHLELCFPRTIVVGRNRMEARGAVTFTPVAFSGYIQNETIA